MARPLIWWRVIIGFMAAAFAPSVVVGIVNTLSSDSFAFLPIFVVYPLIVTIPIVLLFGPPLVILFRRKGWESWGSFALGGAAVGPASLLLLQLLAHGDLSWNQTSVGNLAFGVVLGAIGALALRSIVYTGVRAR